MRSIKQPITVIGTFCNGVFMVNNFCLPNEKVCIVYKQSLPEKGANLKIGVQGTRYRVITEEVENDLLVRKNRSLWREGDAWYIEKQVEDED